MVQGRGTPAEVHTAVVCVGTAGVAYRNHTGSKSPCLGKDCSCGSSQEILAVWMWLDVMCKETRSRGKERSSNISCCVSLDNQTIPPIIRNSLHLVLHAGSAPTACHQVLAGFLARPGHLPQFNRNVEPPSLPCASLGMLDWLKGLIPLPQRLLSVHNIQKGLRRQTCNSTHGIPLQSGSKCNTQHLNGRADLPITKSWVNSQPAAAQKPTSASTYVTTLFSTHSMPASLHASWKALKGPDCQCTCSTYSLSL